MYFRARTGYLVSLFNLRWPVMALRYPYVCLMFCSWHDLKYMWVGHLLYTGNWKLLIPLAYYQTRYIYIFIYPLMSRWYKHISVEEFTITHFIIIGMSPKLVLLISQYLLNLFTTLKYLKFVVDNCNKSVRKMQISYVIMG